MPGCPGMPGVGWRRWPIGRIGRGRVRIRWIRRSRCGWSSCAGCIRAGVPIGCGIGWSGRAWIRCRAGRRSAGRWSGSVWSVRGGGAGRPVVTPQAPSPSGPGQPIPFSKKRPCGRRRARRLPLHVGRPRHGREHRPQLSARFVRRDMQPHPTACEGWAVQGRTPPYDLAGWGTVLSTALRDPGGIGPVTPEVAGALGSDALIGVLVGGAPGRRRRGHPRPADGRDLRAASRGE
jgi:hypothetical protein